MYDLVWWKRYKKSDSTWETATNLTEDGAQENINEYESEHND